MEHMAEIGNWMAIPFGDPRVELLKQQFEIVGIPMLVVFNGETG